MDHTVLMPLAQLRQTSLLCDNHSYTYFISFVSMCSLYSFLRLLKEEVLKRLLCCTYVLVVIGRHWKQRSHVIISYPLSLTREKIGPDNVIAMSTAVFR